MNNNTTTTPTTPTTTTTSKQEPLQQSQPDTVMVVHDNDDNKTKDNYFESNYDKCIKSFDNMGLSEELLRGIYAHGFDKPSPIQSRAIMPVIFGHDTIAQAQSGTGKTGTFAIASLQKLDLKLFECQILILAPTRELAIQIHKVINNLSVFLKCSNMLCVGGTSVTDNIKTIESHNNQVMVGTPGRINDLLLRGILNASHIKLFVLDEADEMLSRGFLTQIHECFKYLPNNVQVGLFSATMPENVLKLTQKFMRNPIRILAKREQLTLEGIKQYFVAVGEEIYKLPTLQDLYESLNINQAIIFCNTRKKSIFVKDNLKQNNFSVSLIHGDMKQMERNEIMNEFRSGQTRILISTNLLGRGIDIHQVSLVINYDLPRNYDNYLHRIGRSGRYGRKGIAINFVNDEDEIHLIGLQKYYNTVIDELPSDLDSIMS